MSFSVKDTGALTNTPSYTGLAALPALTYALLRSSATVTSSCYFMAIGY